MITIGIDASRANVKERTGTEWYAWNVIQELKHCIPSKGFQVVLYSKEPLVRDFFPLPAHWRVRVLQWLPRLMWTQLRMSLHFILPWNRPEVLYLPAHTIPIIHPKRVVMVAHDLGFEREPELYDTRFIGGKMLNALIRMITLGRYGTGERDYHRWSMRFAVRHAYRLIAISHFTARELFSLYHVPREKVVIIPNGYNPPHKESPTPPQQRDSILYIGRIEHKKNLLLLIEAFALFRERITPCPTLFCVGRKGFGAEEIEKHIRTYHLKQQVILPGYLHAEALVSYWQRARLFVLPSHYEGFGIPILEAMARGVLVACSDLPSLREVGGPYCFYFDQNQPKAIAAALVEAWQLPEEQRQQRITQARGYVEQFSWSRCASLTWQVLAQAVD